MPAHRYLIGVGSNQRHHRHGSPLRTVKAGIAAMAQAGMAVGRVAPILGSAPLGPSRRRYANTVVEIETRMEPEPLLRLLKAVECDFGRKQRGMPWSARVLDLDIVLWDGGAWASPRLVVPHVSFRERGFVLGPAAAIAPGWRDPVSGLTLRQLFGRLTRRARIPR